MRAFKHVDSNKALFWPVWLVAGIALLLAGAGYRVAASRYKLIVEKIITLPVPLRDFPVKAGDWFGTDLAIPSTTKEYMERHFADDFLSRRYINGATEGWVDVYIVYCSSRPAGILGHRPRVCYPAHGWVHDGTEPSQFISQVGRKIPCLIHRFHKPAPGTEQIVILNFYILNGQLTTDESDFSDPFGRRPNIAGDPARYVAQVQISSVLENAVRAAAEDMTDLLLDSLPNEDGKVKAVEYTYTTSGVLK